MKSYSELSGKKLKVRKAFDIYAIDDIVDVITAHQNSFTIRKSSEHLPMTINFGRNAFKQYFQVL